LPRLVELPASGHLIVATDLQGNLDDYTEIERRFREARASRDDVYLLITGDLVHGPEIPQEVWPSHLGAFYKGRSAEVVKRAIALQADHPGHVFFLLGNHEHAHIGGPVVSKFFPDEAQRLENLMGDDDARTFREWIRTWPFVCIAPSAGLCFTHAAPYAKLQSRADLDQLPLEVNLEEEIDLEGRATIIALLWARTSSSERAHAFMRALDPALRVAVYGHDVANEGYAIDREPLLCVSSSFGCHHGDKLILEWDLAKRAESAEHVARDGLVPLYVDQPPVFRRPRP
jgi:hypothetical protein